MKSDIYCVFGNKVRNRLVLCLSRGTKNVTGLIQNCGLAQSAVSQHLTKLKSCGIVRSEKVGKEVFYTLRHKKAAEISQLIVSLEREVL